MAIGYTPKPLCTGLLADSGGSGGLGTISVYTVPANNATTVPKGGITFTNTDVSAHTITWKINNGSDVVIESGVSIVAGGSHTFQAGFILAAGSVLKAYADTGAKVTALFSGIEKVLS